MIVVVMYRILLDVILGRVDVIKGVHLYDHLFLFKLIIIIVPCLENLLLRESHGDCQVTFHPKIKRQENVIIFCLK